MTVGKKLRFEIFKRDKFTCQYCGKSAPNVILHVDHIEPVSKGGGDDILNLITSCRDCNLGKGATRLEDSDSLVKQKKQLDSLQERREQMEMMIEWRKSLLQTEYEMSVQAFDLFKLMCRYDALTISQNGLQDIQKLIDKYGLQEVITSMDIATKQYLEFSDVINGKPTVESVNKAFGFIPGICRNRLKDADKPYMGQLRYIRGIIKNRARLTKHSQEWDDTIDILETLVSSNVPLEEIKEECCQIESYSDFINLFYCLISKYDPDNKEQE